MANDHQHSPVRYRVAILDSVPLAVACLLTYMLVTDVLSHVYRLSRADDLIGGLWAVIATVFVFRDSYQHSVAAAVSRLADTVVGVVIGVAAAWLGLRVRQRAGGEPAVR